MNIDPRMAAFESLTVDQRHAAIRQMAGDGVSEYGIASACRVSVEVVRQVIGERQQTVRSCAGHSQ